MMDRDGRLLETWGGRRGRNSSSCFYLLHTHMLVPHILLCASRVCRVQALPATLTSLLLHTLPGLCLSSGLRHVYVLGVAGCFHEGVCIYCLPSMIYLHLHPGRSFAKNPLGILFFHHWMHSAHSQPSPGQQRKVVRGISESQVQRT